MNTEQFVEYNEKRNHLIKMEKDHEKALAEAVFGENWEQAAKMQNRLNQVYRMRQRLQDNAPSE